VRIEKVKNIDTMQSNKRFIYFSCDPLRP